MEKTAKTLLVIVIVSQLALSLNWWNNNWKHRKELTIHSESNQTQEEIFELKLNTQKLIEEEKLKQDCSDLRIVNQGKTLPLHVENCNTEKTDLYAEINITNHTPEGKTYLYYGYPRADPLSSEFSTGYEDEFEDGERNTHLWETQTRKWYNCRSFCYGESGNPSDDTTLIEEKQNHIKIYTKAKTNIYGGEPENSPRDHAEATLESKLPVLNNVTDETYYYMKHNLGTRGDESIAESKIYLTDGSTTKKIYERRLRYGESMDWESAVYRLTYNQSENEVTLYRSELGLGHNSMTEKEYKDIENWKTGSTRSDWSNKEELSSVKATNLNTTNLRVKFISYSNAVRNTGASYTRTGSSHIQLYFLRSRIKRINITKSTEQTIPHLKANTSWINPVEDDYQGNYKIPIKIKNKGTFKTTNLTLNPISANRNLSKNNIGTLEPGEKATIYLDQDIDEPRTTNIRIEADSEENNQILFLDDEVAYFNQTVNQLSLNLDMNPNKTKKELKINKTIRFHSDNTINIPNATYKTPEPKEISCSTQGNQLDVKKAEKEGFTFELGTVDNEKQVTCTYTLDPIKTNLYIEEHREQNPDTLVKPLSPVTTQENIKVTNKANEPPYGPINKQIEFKYNYSANKDWKAKDPRSGEIEIEPNQTKEIQIKLEKDNVITKQRRKRKQHLEKTTEVNGTAYTVIPIKLNNTDTIKYHNISWSSTATQGWKPIKKKGTTELEPKEERNIHLEQKKENMLTYTRGPWNIKKANLSLQIWNTTATINNTDQINYTQISIPGNCKEQLSCNTDLEVTLTPGKNTVEMQARGDRIENTWVTEPLGPVKINQDISKEMKIKTKSRYNRNFTNLSLQYKEEPRWNCTTYRNKVKALTEEKNYHIATCNGSNVIKLKEKHPIESKTPVTTSTQKIDAVAPIELNNTDPRSTYNITIPLTDLNISKAQQTTSHTAKIKANETKKIEVPFKAPIKAEKRDINTDTFPGEHQHMTKISSNLSNHVKNISFIQDKGKNWKNISLYKCINKNPLNCSASNLSNWQRIKYEAENGEITREGDPLSTLTYVTSYDIEEDSEDDGDSGSNGGGAGGGAGGLGGGAASLEPERNDTSNKTPENKTLEKETKKQRLTGKKLQILEPVSRANTSFKAKVKALNVKDCIIKIDNSRWKQMNQEQGILTRSYSDVKSGQHELHVKCASLEDYSTFKVVDDLEKSVDRDVMGASVSHSPIDTTLFYLVIIVSLIAFSVVLYHFRNRVSLSWVRRRMGD